MSRRVALALLWSVCLVCACSHGRDALDAARVDGPMTTEDGGNAAPDGPQADAGGPDLGPDGASCITSFACDARTAEHQCGVTTMTGQRYPDQGAPYCTDKLSPESSCSCALLRCTSPAPLCAGSYRASFTERLISGCNGNPGQLDGTCDAVWNQVQLAGAAMTLADKSLLNVDMTFGSADYPLPFTLPAPAVVHSRSCRTAGSPTSPASAMQAARKSAGSQSVPERGPRPGWQPACSGIL